MNTAFGWAFIGAGTLGTKVAKEITKSGRHKVVSVYVRNPEKRAVFAAQYGALAAETPEQAITADGVDGVYIVTPHTSHFAYTKLALELGKPVLCEKPVTTDAKQSAELIRLSREKGVFFAEAMWTWFAPVARQIKTWYDAGEYGEITSFRMNYHLKSINYAPRVSDPNLAGGALLMVLVACRLDLMIGSNYIRDACVIALVINETLSIVENLGLMGVPIPKVIINAIDILKRREDEKKKE